MIYKLLKSLAFETVKLIISKPSKIKRLFVIGYISKWRASLSPGRNALIDQLPWISFAAIDFLEKNLGKNMTVFEYGAGGSTLFFSSRVKSVVSVEHDPAWYRNVTTEIDKLHINNCEIKLVEPKPDSACTVKNAADPNSYVSGDKNYKGMSFKEYVSSIDMYPDGYFDVVLIDGRSRPSCTKHVKDKIKFGGFIVLDNSETDYYNFIHEDMDNEYWKKQEYYGLFPYMFHFSETCVWQKVKKF
jgi:hypothetical protein